MKENGSISNWKKIVFETWSLSNQYVSLFSFKKKIKINLSHWIVLAQKKSTCCMNRISYYIARASMNNMFQFAANFFFIFFTLCREPIEKQFEKTTVFKHINSIKNRYSNSNSILFYFSLPSHINIVGLDFFWKFCFVNCTQ